MLFDVSRVFRELIGMARTARASARWKIEVDIFRLCCKVIDDIIAIAASFIHVARQVWILVLLQLANQSPPLTQGSFFDGIWDHEWSGRHLLYQRLAILVLCMTACHVVDKPHRSTSLNTQETWDQLLSSMPQVHRSDLCFRPTCFCTLHPPTH